ncbi:MAG: methylenetetrahydrofolate reductase [Bilophila wadsworthia]
MNIGQLIAERGKPFYSFEFFPPKDPDQWPDFFKMAERLAPLEPLFTSVTYGAGGSSQDATLEIVSHLKKEFQFETMAHLTCVGATQDYITQYLQRLRDNGVDNVLALRGDIPRGRTSTGKPPNPPCRRSRPFRQGALSRHGHRRRRYPAPIRNRRASPATGATPCQNREGADFVITQLFFDVREYLHFVDRLSDMGVSVPVIPGILPIQSLESIRRTLSLCGANIPGKLYLALEEANAKGGAEAVREAGLKFAVQQIRTLLDNGAPGIHLYTLNKASMCLRIAEEVGAL